MLTIRAMTGGAGYAERHLQHSDYYDENHRVAGAWHGQGARLVGLHGEVKSAQFEAIREGMHPLTGDYLRPRHSSDRLDDQGNTQTKARSLYDLTFSAPKSISIQAVVGGDERLIAAHDKSVQAALGEGERYAATRVRLAHSNDNRTTSNWIVATYRHDTSRELDPQLHTHAVAANLTYDGAEGRWKALQASGLYERRAYLTEVYRNALAREVRGLGYEIESRRDPRGRDLGFEIRGVPNGLLERYSQRSVQRDAAIDDFTREHGRRPTDNEIAVLVRESRTNKLTEITTEELRQQQQARISPEELKSLKQLRSNSLEQSREVTQQFSSAPNSLQYAKDHLFERRSVVHDYELLTESLRHGRGQIDPSQLRGTLEIDKSRGDIIYRGDRVATRESLEREQRMIATVNQGIGPYGRLGGPHHFQPQDQLRDEQKRAVQQILDSHDFAINLRGAAGTGKTATLQEIDRGLREAGHGITAVAPTRSAVEELQKVGFRDAMTVSRLLEDETAQSALRQRVLIVDEAGMISGRQMEGLLRLADQQQARVLFSGDTRQIQSVEASDALRILERESQMKSFSLTGVQRQTHAQYKDAIQTLRQSPEEGFAKLERMGAVREVPFLDRAHQVADLYREMTLDSSRRILVVAPTHEEIGRVTRAIREDLIERGQLGASITIDRYVPLQWTEAQKRDLSNFREGQVLLMHRTGRGMEKHEALIVDRAEAGFLVARNAQGEEKTFTPVQTRAFSVHEQRPIKVAPGDLLLLTGNRRDAEFRATNGELVKVHGVEGGRIQLEDGRAIPTNYHSFDHGYAITAHRSQGKTVDGVIVSADAMQQELFYVAASRGRSEIAIMTSDREQLQESLGISSARTSAIELAREPMPSASVEHSMTQDLTPKSELEIPAQEISMGFEIGLGI
ncbi:MobF family relaxase [Acidicapsa acidisoli]|uniref:MobF family relaxase n=1 Tax=Acidicapsa acidisoli TaxID=1615681 RepID=UPI0021E0F6F4|nr:MobF family relaxase [Acidicapsa acidisoli]